MISLHLEGDRIRVRGGVYDDQGGHAEVSQVYHRPSPFFFEYLRHLEETPTIDVATYRQIESGDFERPE